MERTIYQQSFFKNLMVQNFSTSKFIISLFLSILFLIWSWQTDHLISLLFSILLILLITNFIIKIQERKKLKKLATEIENSPEKLFVVFNSNKDFCSYVIKKEDLIKLLKTNFSFYCEKIEVFNKENHQAFTLLTPTII